LFSSFAIFERQECEGVGGVVLATPHLAFVW